MLTAAITAEYNPFHLGHKYHIDKTREAGATHIVVIMSGNYTQRGTPAILPKHVRAKMALSEGADLVIELPVAYSVATAQRFAFGSTTLAEGLGCVDLFSFGSESGYLTLIDAASRAVDSTEVLERMRELLKEGMTFAKARQQAVEEICGNEVADILGTPNDLLGVEYIRQLRAIGSSISPFAVERCGPGHDSDKICGPLASASLLRGYMRTGSSHKITDFMPCEAYRIMQEEMEKGNGPFNEAKFEDLMLGVLRRIGHEELSSLPDISEGLENRIYAAIRQATAVDEIYSFAKSKRYTAARIRRIVMSAFLGLDGNLSSLPCPYIRVLGFNAKGREILQKAKKTASIPVSDSLAYLKKQGVVANKFAETEAVASDLYTLALPVIRPCGYDFTVDSVRL